MSSRQPTHLILHQIQETIGSEASPAAVRRLLRVPPVWQELHDPSVLDPALRSHGPEITAAAVVTDFDAALDVRTLRHEQVIAGELLPASIEDMAVLRKHVLDREWEEIAEFGDFFAQLGDAGAWLLACIWPDLPQQDQLAQQFIESRERRRVGALIGALLANYDPAASAEALQAASLPRFELLALIDPLQEPELSELLAREIDGAENLPQRQSALDSTFARGLAEHVLGQPEAAETALETAWQLTAQRGAQIADRIAHVAEQRGDWTLAVQARQRAFEQHPAPARRAGLALSTLRAGDAMQATQLVTAPYEADEERIAAASIHAELGQIDSAQQVLDGVTPDGLAGIWRQRLSAAWQELGRQQPAIEALQAAVRCRPLDPELRSELAELLLRAGAGEAAMNHAALAAYLSPADLAARRTLAHSLSQQGDHEQALNQWLEIVQQDPAARPAVVETALSAGDVGTALSFAQELLAQDPDSAIARTAMGKALLASGNPESGREHLRRATSIAPDDADSWVALAQAEAKLGDAERAGKTLQSALQSCPADAGLRAAYTDWLCEHERWTEAAEQARKALDLEPDAPAHILRCAELEQHLGRAEAARSLYEKALRLRPAEFEIQAALATIYEQDHEHAKALEVLSEPPEAAAAETHALYGRLLVQTAEAEPDRDRGERALTALENAVQAGYQHEAIDFWRGRAQALAGNHQQALRSFQSCLKSLPESANTLREACICEQARAALADDQAPVAISLLENALESGMGTAPVLTHLASAYLAASLPDEALDAARKAVELDPQPAARKNLIEAAKACGAWQLLVQKAEQWRSATGAADPFALDRALALHQLGRHQEARDAVAHALWPQRHQPRTVRAAANVLRRIEQPKAAQRLLATAHRAHRSDATILTELALAAHEAHDYETAYQAWTDLTEQEPENDRALVGAADALWQLDRRAASIGLLQRAVKQRPDDGALHAKLAQAQLDNGEIAQALDHYRTAVELNPEAADTAWEAAQALLQHNAPKQALAVLQTLLEQEPQRAEAMLATAEAHLRLGEPKQALATIGRLSERADSAAAQALRCLAQRELGDHDAAERSLQSALAAPSMSSRDLRWQLELALGHGRWQEAEALLNAVQDDDGEIIELATWARTRLAAAHWLLSGKGDVIFHAPSDGAVNRKTLAEQTKLLEAHPAVGPHLLGQLSRGLQLAFGEVTTTEFDQPLMDGIREPWLNASARDSWVTALLREGRAERALQTLAEAPARSLAPGWSPLLAGLAHLELDDSVMARKAFGALESDSPLRPAAAYFTALAWLADDRPQEAVNALNNAVLAWPEEANWQHKLASVYLSLDKPEAALPHLQQALDQRPDDLELQTDYARALRASGSLSEAERVFATILPRAEDDHAIWHAAAATALALGEAQTAQQRYDHVLSINPDDASARIGAAKAANANGDERGSREHVERVLRRPPSEVSALIELGQVLVDHNRHDKALEIFDQALRTAERPLTVHRARSELLLKMGRAQEAIQALQRVVEADPGDDRAWSALAEGYELAGQPDQAVDALRMALEARPGSIPHQLRLAQMHRSAGQLDQALGVLTELEREAPQNASVAFELGRVHEERRQHQKALHHFERSIAINGASAAAHFHAGRVLKALKAYGRAAEMFRKAAELNPNDSDSLHQLAAVQALELVHGGQKQQTSAVTP